MKRALLLWTVMMPLAGQTVPSGTQLTPQQREGLLKQIAELEGSLSNSRSSLLKAAMDAFQAASASEREAYDFYLACQKELLFKDRKESDFREWRDRNESKTKTHSQMLAMHYQLRYLVLSIRALQADDPATLAPEVRSLVREIVGQARTLEGDINQLRSPVQETPFAKVYEIQSFFKLDNWSMAPLNLADVYGKFLIPMASEKSPQSVIELWDERIGLEKALVDPANEEALQAFSEKQLPVLLWQRSKARLETGDQVQGFADMIRVLKENGDHPNALGWLNELKALAAPPAAAAETPAATPPAPQGAP